jgi:hypothetical protein
MRTETLYQVNAAACPEQWREVSQVGNLDRLRTFVRYWVIVRENGCEVERHEIARGKV